MSEGWKMTCRLKPYIQPFERVLALRELQQLAGDSLLQELDNSTEPLSSDVQSQLPPEHLIDRLAYWESICTPEFHWTKQLLREATIYVVRNGVNPADLPSLVPFRDKIPVPTRRCLRYGPHDIHEYRGKFFPQLVRALINLSDLRRGATILDPMCGSGTTLVEANLSGYNAIGIDLNPLSVMISRTKCGILRLSPATVIREYEHIRDALLNANTARVRPHTQWFDSLPREDQRYLLRWFTPEVLVDLEAIVALLNNIAESPCRDLFWLSLSDILRTVSWQKTDDLRVRREEKSDNDFDVTAEFLHELSKTVRHVVAFLLEERTVPNNVFHVICGDARALPQNIEPLSRRIDAIITSPPYATALPYLDTDRLSLCYLKLLPRYCHRPTDYLMIGNREVTEGKRAAIWTHYVENKHTLPSEISLLIETVESAYNPSNAGFRRRNLPALLAKYFFDMREVFTGIRQVLRPGGHIFVVVGDNHTLANDKRIEIETSRLLALLGVSLGFAFVESIPMEMLKPRDIFKKNAVASEHIVHLRLPS